MLQLQVKVLPAAPEAHLVKLKAANRVSLTGNLLFYILLSHLKGVLEHN